MYDADKYTYRLEWSVEDQCHIARSLEFPTLMAHGASAQIALQEIEIVVTETILWLQEEKDIIPEPFGLKRYKGDVSLRIPPELHKALTIQSAEQGISLNQYILGHLSTLL